MISDKKIVELRKLVREDKMPIKAAALKTNICETSARKYLGSNQLPSEMKKPLAPRAYRTRPDAFAGVWDECVSHLEENPELTTKALFKHLERKYPKQFKPEQLRTLQRRVKAWRGMQENDVYFEQERNSGKEA